MKKVQRVYKALFVLIFVCLSELNCMRILGLLDDHEILNKIRFRVKVRYYALCTLN